MAKINLNHEHLLKVQGRQSAFYIAGLVYVSCKVCQTSEIHFFKVFIFTFKDRDILA